MANLKDRDVYIQTPLTVRHTVYMHARSVSQGGVCAYTLACSRLVKPVPLWRSGEPAFPVSVSLKAMQYVNVKNMYHAHFHCAGAQAMLALCAVDRFISVQVLMRG